MGGGWEDVWGGLGKGVWEVRFWLVPCCSYKACCALSCALLPKVYKCDIVTRRLAIAPPPLLLYSFCAND